MKISKMHPRHSLSDRLSGASWAVEYEPDEGTEARVPTVVHDMLMLEPEQPFDPETIRADLDYAADMKRHHEGAVTMARDYLEDPRGANPILRKMARAHHRQPALRDRRPGRHPASCRNGAGDRRSTSASCGSCADRRGSTGSSMRGVRQAGAARDSWTWRWRRGSNRPSAT